MQIIPVLDLLHGVVVRGVAGERQNYHPIQSQLADVPLALDLAYAIRDRFGLSTFYIADLDAILSGEPNLDCYLELAEEGFILMVDAGLGEMQSARQVRAAGADFLIAGLESLPGPTFLAELCREFGAERVIFSLDLKQGGLLFNRDGAGREAWEADDPLAVADIAIAQGIDRLIVLDLAQVGVGAGIATVDLCRQIRKRHPTVRVITGGGLRDARDIEAMHTAGIDGLLVASALHNGRLSRADVERWGRA